ncbi:hypothetical protein HCN44_002455 [Aphidius gifuensis]|uniref:Tudor domain-containing protein n=1 Tax=Aphidius gifuensis TaxID=684658 RepID=A0A835CU94_APHGI|nr:hypothetical protein HCN44_002455 [Aphidius gifuensis]
MVNKKMTTSNCHLGSSKTKFNNYKKLFQINDIFPDDVIKLGECVGQIPVDKFEPKNIDEYEEVLVVEVFSPSHFYIHQKNNILEFYEMMEALHNFYEQYKLHYIIPKIALQPGLHVAVKYFDKWHRGIIKNVNDYSKIEVKK